MGRGVHCAQGIAEQWDGKWVLVRTAPYGSTLHWVHIYCWDPYGIPLKPMTSQEQKSTKTQFLIVIIFTGGIVIHNLEPMILAGSQKNSEA